MSPPRGWGPLWCIWPVTKTLWAPVTSRLWLFPNCFLWGGCVWVPYSALNFTGMGWRGTGAHLGRHRHTGASYPALCESCLALVSPSHVLQWPHGACLYWEQRYSLWPLLDESPCSLCTWPLWTPRVHTSGLQARGHGRADMLVSEFASKRHLLGRPMPASPPATSLISSKSLGAVVWYCACPEGCCERMCGWWV